MTFGYPKSHRPAQLSLFFLRSTSWGQTPFLFCELSRLINLRILFSESSWDYLTRIPPPPLCIQHPRKVMSAVSRKWVGSPQQLLKGVSPTHNWIPNFWPSELLFTPLALFWCVTAVSRSSNTQPTHSVKFWSQLLLQQDYPAGLGHRVVTEHA